MDFVRARKQRGRVHCGRGEVDGGEWVVDSEEGEKDGGRDHRIPETGNDFAGVRWFEGAWG
jgi:hypothetical protein